MKFIKRLRPKHLLATLALTLALTCAAPLTGFGDATLGTGSYDQPYSVTQMLQTQAENSTSVQGYIVGQPLSSTAIIQSSFNSNSALAIADSPTETDTAKMIYIQIPSKYRSAFGLQSNPSLLGQAIKVEGQSENYFSHDGMKYVTKIATTTIDNTTPDPTPDPDPTPNPDPTPTPDPTPNPGSNTTPSEYDSTYYKDALGKTGSSLKNSLHNIIDDHKELSYAAVWDGICATDEDPSNKNNVILLYTGRSQSKSSKGGGADNWNREHVWAKSHGDFGTSPGPGTDLHHLRATDVSVNAKRSNLDFDMGGSPHVEATECRYDSDSWEPRDAVKGDIARMLFYMAVRYEGDSSEVDLELNNQVQNGSDPFMGKLSVLLEWNRQDPVDEMEKRRNNIIFEKFQNNRNPFIDHPEWADQIWAS